jgi:hypothetical protein
MDGRMRLPPVDAVEQLCGRDAEGLAQLGNGADTRLALSSASDASAVGREGLVRGPSVLGLELLGSLGQLGERPSECAGDAVDVSP